jgi:iron complex outermembrane receptor protein
MLIPSNFRRTAGRAALFAAASLWMVATANPAQAQDEGDEAADADNKDIIVTAQFREQRLQDTPLAITALSGEDIENKALSNIVEIAATAPNVNIQNTSGSQGGPTIYIRGVGQYDSNFAFEPGVGVYIDDVYHGVLNGSLFDLLDLERVEILRGPQGTLAGRNSIGGAVKLFSRTPQGDGSGFVSATYGSLNRIELRAAYDVGLADNVALRVSGFGKRRDGYVDILDFACDQPGAVLPGDNFPTQAQNEGCKIGELGGIEAFGLRAALRFTPSDQLDINIVGSITRDNSDVIAMEQTSSSDPRFVAPRPYVFYGTFDSDAGWNDEPSTTSDFQSISGKVDWHINDNLTLTSITAYEDLYSSWIGDTEGGPSGVGLTRLNQPYHQFTQELRLSGEVGDGMLEYTVGGFYFDSKGYVGARVYSFPILNWIQHDPVTSESKAAYAHVVFHPVEAMSVIGGIRYTDDSKEYTFVRLDPATGLPAAIVGSLNGVTGSYAGDSFDYRLGVDYRFSDALMAYAQFSTGYKGGGIAPRPFIPAQVVPFDPERVNAFEVGFKSDFADNRVRLNMAAFLNKYRGIILIDANGFPGSPGDPDWFPLSAVPFNAGKADIKGVELETTIEPVDGLTLQGSVSWLDFEYKSLDPNATASGITLDFLAPYTPEWRWSVDLAYEIPLASGATITPRFYADYTDSYFTDPVNAATNHIDARTILNANIAFRTADEGWELIAGVTNIADKHYYVNAFDIIAINGNNSQAVGRPREFFVTARKNF